MGDGYTGIMADVLKYAVDNPSILANFSEQNTIPMEYYLSFKQ